MKKGVKVPEPVRVAGSLTTKASGVPVAFAISTDGELVCLTCEAAFDDREAFIDHRCKAEALAGARPAAKGPALPE